MGSVTTYNLRHYQVKAVNAALAGSGLLILPQGSGKSVIIGELSKLFSDCLIVVPRIKLKEQNKRFAKECYTINTAYRRHMQADVLIIDEAHLVKENKGMYQDVISRCKTVIGLTATPFRLDVGHIVPDIFPRILYEVKRENLVRYGYLATRIYENIHPDNLLTVKSFITTKMSIQACPQSAKCLYDLLSRNPGKTIIFCCDILHCEKVHEILGGKSAIVHSKLSKEELQKAYEDFKENKVQFLINCEMLTLGYDEPEIESVCLLRPTDSYTLFEQMIGRGDRKTDNKTTNRIFDYTANSFNFKAKKSNSDGMQYCLECGEYVDYRKIKCSSCGKKLIKGEAPRKTCVYCNEKNHTKSTYCVNCGKFIKKTLKCITSTECVINIDTGMFIVDKTEFKMDLEDLKSFYEILELPSSKRKKHFLKKVYTCSGLRKFTIYYSEKNFKKQVVKIDVEGLTNRK